MKIQLAHTYDDIISVNNLLCAWEEFVVDKSSKPDVIIFAGKLMDNIFSLREDLVNRTYQHGTYQSFFINDPFSCRNDKGMHRALNRFREFAYQVSRNHTRTCWVLKCDIKQFFASVDQGILMQILVRYIRDVDILNLLTNILDSFHTKNQQHVGLPLGNLTSQLFTNIYMNEFDQWVKHKLKATYYIRYADDFVFLSEDRDWLGSIIDRKST